MKTIFVMGAKWGTRFSATIVMSVLCVGSNYPLPRRIQAMLTDYEIYKIAKPYICMFGDHWSCEPGIHEDDIDEFARDIERAVFRWFDLATDGPPKKNGDYLIHKDSGLITTSFFATDYHYFDSYRDAITPLSRKKYGKWSRHFEHARVWGYRVTHWAYLPKPPGVIRGRLVPRFQN
jgi:hypothetical protein